jgi:hypothetical protein
MSNRTRKIEIKTKDPDPKLPSWSLLANGDGETHKVLSSSVSYQPSFRNYGIR